MRRTIFAASLALLAALTVTARAEADDPAKPAKKPTLTGEVTFKDTPTFEEGTEVVIQVQDTSRADAKAVVLGTKTIKDPKKAPIAFEVEYDDSKIKPRDRISLSVRISHKGKLLYINDTRIAVVNPPGKTKAVMAPVVAVKRAKP
jgi:uncharacterized lipoprotein YbaY